MPDLRGKLKSGPLNQVYGYARWAKRRLTGERVETTGVHDPVPLPLDRLRALADTMPAHGRRYFSLASGYLETGAAADLPRALACLRCAQALNFESPERLVLYSALVLAKYGEQAPAAALIEAYAPEEFTPAENALRSQIQEGKVALLWESQEDDPRWEAGREALQQQGEVDSLLVVGDEQARSARWFPHARYFLAAGGVNGITPERVAQCGLRFAWGIGPAEQVASLQDAGATCDNWLTIAAKERE